MNDLSPDGEIHGHLRCVGVLAEDGNEDIEHFLDHASELGAFVLRVEVGAGEVSEQTKSVEDGDDDEVRWENDECGLENEEVLIVA